MSDSYCLKLRCYNCGSGFEKDVKKGFKEDGGIIIPDERSYCSIVEEEAAREGKQIYERVFCPNCNCSSLVRSAFVMPITVTYFI